MIMDDVLIESIDLAPPIAIRPLPAFERSLHASTRDVGLLNTTPWVRTLGKLQIDVTTHGWRFPTPEELTCSPAPQPPVAYAPGSPKAKTRVKPPSDMV